MDCVLKVQQWSRDPVNTKVGHVVHAAPFHYRHPRESFSPTGRGRIFSLCLINKFFAQDFNWGEKVNITLLTFLVHHLNIKSCYREACGGLKEDDRTLFQMTANEKLNKTDYH